MKSRQWESTAPVFKIPFGEDPAMLPAVAAQQALAHQTLEYIRDRHEVATYRIAEMQLGPGGIEPALSAVPYAGFSRTISDALAGRRLVTFDVYCELLAVLGPDVVPTTSTLFEAMDMAIQSVKVWPSPDLWTPRQTRLVTERGGPLGGVNYATGATMSSEPERLHPDGDVAIAGLLMELREAIDAWGGPGTTDGLEVEIDVYVGDASANLVVVNDAITGQMWLPADWGTRIAEEVRSPGGVLVLDEEGEQDVAGRPVPLYRVVAPLIAFEPDAWDNGMYLAIGDGVARVWLDADGGGIEWMPLGRE